jgi:hypothetical protein
MKLGLGRARFGEVEVAGAATLTHEAEEGPADAEVAELAVGTMRDLTWFFDQPSESVLVLPLTA